MNPQAIMTPGGIADQFTRGLSGVAQAFADRSRIDREAARDAFARQQAADALARQEEQMEYARGRDTLADKRYAEEQRIKMLGLAPENFQKDPVLGGAATRTMEEIARVRDQRERELGFKGFAVPATENAPIGSYVPKEYSARAEGYAAHNAAQAFEVEKIRAAAEARAQATPEKPLSESNTATFRDASGKTVMLPIGEGIKMGLTPVKLDPTTSPIAVAKVKYEADSKKHAADRSAFVTKIMQWDPKSSDAVKSKYAWYQPIDVSAERMAAIAEWDAQNPTPTIQLDGAQNVQTMTPSASSAVGGSDRPLMLKSFDAIK